MAFCEAPPAVNNSSRGRARGVRNSCFLLPALPHCLVGGVGGWIVQKSQGVFWGRDVCVFLALSGEEKIDDVRMLKKERKRKKQRNTFEIYEGMPLSSKIVFGQSEHREKKWTTQQPNHHTHVPDVLVSTDVKVLKVVGLGSVVLLVVSLMRSNFSKYNIQYRNLSAGLASVTRE